MLLFEHYSQHLRFLPLIAFGLWRILANLPLRLSINEAATAAIRLGGAGASDTRGTIPAKFPSETEEDSGQKEAGHGSPGEGHKIATNASLLVG
jgi:hypothetical protein